MIKSVLTRRMALPVIAMGAVGAAMAMTAGGAQPDGPVLTPAQAHDAAGKGEILLVDIRRPDEWAATGLGEHAVGIDLRDDDFIARVQQARQNDQPIALICARGVRSARTARKLQEAGLATIIDIPEGMLGSRAGRGWIAGGLPVVQP